MKTKLFLLVAALALAGCSKKNEEPYYVSITTNSVSEKEVLWDNKRFVYVVNISSGGYIADANITVVEKGVAWNSTGNPNIARDTFVVAGEGVGWYAVRIKDLRWKTPYYIRAYASTAAGVVYGQEVRFELTEDDWHELRK